MDQPYLPDLHWHSRALKEGRNSVPILSLPGNFKTKEQQESKDASFIEMRPCNLNQQKDTIQGTDAYFTKCRTSAQP